MANELTSQGNILFYSNENEKELDKNSVTEKFSVTASEEKNYNTQCYNLDAIISVGYKVNSKKATRFCTNRLWIKLMLNTKFLIRDKKSNLILLKK